MLTIHPTIDNVVTTSSIIHGNMDSRVRSLKKPALQIVIRC